MEQTQRQGSTPSSGTVDKSRVLSVKPLRCLVPMFPSASNQDTFPMPQAAAPLVCASPSGPFPSGFSPFYPFSCLPDQTPISNAAPIGSVQTPGTANGEAGSSKRGAKSHEKKVRKKASSSQDINFASVDLDIDAMVDDILESFNLTTFNTYRRDDGDKDLVGYLLLIFELVKRKISQLEDSMDSAPKSARRADLRAGTILMNKGIRTNMKKRIGHVPGVEIGDIFYFRMELCLVGLHAPSMAGIDYMSLRVTHDDDPVAVSIVSSGGYEDNAEDGNVLIYSGQGGNLNKKDKEITDQKLERGNLALEKSLHRGNEVRVIRGIRDLANPTGKVYVYDGLYKLQESWMEKGKSGYNVFKYKLVRLPGQPEGFTMWKLIQKWRDDISSRPGLILPDLSSGAEKVPVSLVNGIDGEKPAYFNYISTLRYLKAVNNMEPSVGCICVGGCLPDNINCSCIQANGNSFPYASSGVIVTPKSMIHECGDSCQCPLSCRNRVTQGGVKVRLEVFKTKERGWGLRSWDAIRAGAFICEYGGEVIDLSRAEQRGGTDLNNYIFDATRVCNPVEGLPNEYNEAPKLPFPLVISAKEFGNVARFMNHSCSPNVFWQPVLHENNKECDLHIAFYALRHIPPMMELTYNYGMIRPDKPQLKKKKCLCGSLKCLGYFF